MIRSNVVDKDVQYCSWKTLQSEERGHFSTYLNEILRSNPSAVAGLQEFSSDEERVLFCSSLNRVDSFVVKPVFKKKDEEQARLRREQGNTAFHKKWYKQALVMYSMSIVKAPAGDECLAYSLANRSACLYYLGEIQLCMADVKLALEAGYPAQLHYKLYERLTKCYNLLGEREAAVKYAAQAKRALEKQKDKFEQAKYKNAMQALVKLAISVSSKDPMAIDSIVVAENHVTKVPKLTSKANKKIKEFSNLLRVEYKPAVGRHVVADKAVRAGDTLVVEDPFAAVLYPEKAGSNCDYCFAKLRSVVPCKWCSGVGFCCAECRDKACATYHRYECQYTDLLQGLGASALVRLALRIITQHPLEYFKKQRTDLNVDTEKTEFKSESYLAVFNLVGLDHKRWPEDMFARSVMAVTLLKILKAAKYFGPGQAQTPTDTFTDDEILIGSLLLRHLNVLQFNAHEVYELLRGDRTKLKPCKNHMIGLAVYPRASYFNHSCQPTVTRLNVGKKLVIKCLSPVAKGNQVTDNYGPVFYFKSKADRQRELACRYWFDCECCGCEEDWPLLGKAADQTGAPRWRDQADPAQLSFLQSVFKCGTDFMDNGQTDDAIGSLQEAVTGLHELVRPPLDLLTRTEDKLRTCFNNLGTIVFSDSALKINPAEKSNNPMIK